MKVPWSQTVENVHGASEPAAVLWFVPPGHSPQV
jgi:hypothetical protein